MLRSVVVFSLLLGIKVLSRLFYRPDFRWVGEVPADDPWAGHRLVALLNHTSLFEPLFCAGVPPRFLWRIARHGVVPAADKTIRRPLVGKLFKLVARHVVPITRERDHTWVAVLQRIDPESMVVMAPEGRMKRANGLDAQGQPMTVRGGVADVIEALGHGRMLLAYSGGLHHVQIPGERLPRLWQTVRLRLEVVDIGVYRALLAADGHRDFKLAVKRDLERRRDLHCAAMAAAAGQP